jgi:hypothetical protein
MSTTTTTTTTTTTMAVAEVYYFLRHARTPDGENDVEKEEQVREGVERWS